MTYGNRLREHYKNEYTFSKKDVKRFFYKDKISDEYLDLLLHNFVKKGELTRITTGKYTFKDDIMVSGFSFSPFYYGLQEALSLRNLHEQETNPVIITLKKIKPGIRVISGNNVVLRRISRKYFFGFDFIKYYDMEIPVSDPEKTLIDFVYYNEPLSKETKGELLKLINKQKLNDYLTRYPEKFRKKVQLFIK
jgi:predicted transcriptional regulator of viral defense system